MNFSGTPDAISEMIETGESVHGDLYLDYAVPGHRLSRPGLDELITRATGDPSVSHIFIPRRDRLARPNDPIDALLIEKLLRESGLTLVFMERVLPPLSKGQRQDFMDQMAAMMDYEQAGKFRRELSQKMIYAQIALATAGFSTGGRPPFAFDRWLAKADGTKVRKLVDGEIVRMAGHHVVWLPATDERLKIALRIRNMLQKMPATQVCNILNAEGLPSPDAGRTRTDNRVRHKVSGLWHQSTIVNIGRNSLLAAVSRYGVRSMGDQSRFTPEGPRDLNEEDFWQDGTDNKPKVVRNPESQVIKAPAKFDPVVELAEHERLQEILDKRAGTQRGKPRSRDPNRNPLGTRVFDMNCT